MNNREEKGFLNVQRDFTRRLRSHGSTSLPDNVTEERMRLYQALNYYSINEIVKACFPVLTSILTANQWRYYMEDFIATMTARTPYFNQLPKVFLDYFKTQSEQFEYPFLFELAHYEWLELYIDLMEESIEGRVVAYDEACFDKRLCLSPCAVIADYHYEVDQIGENNLSEEKKPFSVVVYRNQADKVKFMRVNELTKSLITLMSDIGHTPRRAIEILQRKHADIEQDKFILFASEAIMNLIEPGILLEK